MSQLNSRNTARKTFGKRKDVHRIIFAKGDQVTSFTIHPILAYIGVSMALTLAIGYLGATAYLMFRDDLLNASRLRQIAIQNDYEDQLASLRIEIDRITSRQMLDQRSVETKLDKLLGLRASIDERQKAVHQLATSASNAGLSIAQAAPAPRPHPNRKEHSVGSVDHAAFTTGSLIASAYAGRSTHRNTPLLHTDQDSLSDVIRTSNHDLIDLNLIEEHLLRQELEQAQQLKLIAHQTANSSRTLASLIQQLGFEAPSAPSNSFDSIGGPFIEDEAFDPVTFGTSLLVIEENITYLNALKKKIKKLPISRPVKEGQISSQFGRRVDPFLKRYAQHSGIDFRAKTGTPVYATAPGKVVKAKWNGGYGRLVEIKHAGGISTRYAHLSRISVKEGQYVDAGSLIGRVGSSGRSTGPHLHYETRIGKKAVNPGRFLKAGIQVKDLL